MLQIIPSPHEEVVVVKATGLLTDDDYKKFVPELEKLINERGALSVLIEFENFRGWEPKALWADFQIGLKHPDDFKKMAIVGEKAWHHLLAIIARPFTSGEVRYFSHDEIQAAWDWILGKTDSSKESAEQGSEEPEQQEQGWSAEDLRPYSSIVVGMDFSPHAEKALARAVELARHYDATVSVVHAFESIATFTAYPDDFLGEAAFTMYDPELDQQLFSSAEKRLKEAVGQFDYPRIDCQVVWGSPTPTIISFAESQNADLIVAGSHGRKGIARLLGSTANSIMHRARCDVLVVRLD